jgi:hypothetical protein
MSQEKRNQMYECMAGDALELVKGSRNPAAQRDFLVGLCLAVQMMLEDEPNPEDEHPSPFPTGVEA